jgi:acetoacetyl-CoA synthetase
MTNCIESLVLLLATAAIGAIFSSSAPDMGPTGIIERFIQVRPKVIFFESEVLYDGKTIDLRQKLSTVITELKPHVPELGKAVIVQGKIWEDTTV